MSQYWIRGNAGLGVADFQKLSILRINGILRFSNKNFKLICVLNLKKIYICFSKNRNINKNINN